MESESIRMSIAARIVGFAIVALACSSSAQDFHPDIPRVWDDNPIKAEGKEPTGYFDSLKEKEPEFFFDPAKLHTKEDWIRAGKLVFEADVIYDKVRPVAGGRRVRPTLAKFIGKDWNGRG